MVKSLAPIDEGADLVTRDYAERKSKFNVLDYAVGGITPGAARRSTSSSIAAGSSTLTTVSGIFTASDVGKIVTIQDAASRTTVSTGAISSGSVALLATGFQVSDVGTPVKIVGAGAAGVDLLTTITGYVSSTSVILADAAGTTVSSASTTYGARPINGTITSFNSSTSVVISATATWGVSAKTAYCGSNDRAAIQAAGTAAGAAGGRLYIPRGTYLVGSDFNMPYSSVAIEGDGRTASVLVSCAGSTNLLNVDATGKQLSDITISMVGFDTNKQASSRAITLKGGGYSNGDSLSGVQIANCGFSNLDFIDNGFVSLFSGRELTDRGPISDVYIDRNDFGATTKYHVYIQGNDVTNMNITRNRFHDSGFGSIAWNEQTSSDTPNASSRSHHDWVIERNKFYNNQLFGAPGSHIINDVNRAGIRGLDIVSNFFDGSGPALSNSFAINVHSNWGLSIERNTFWKVASCLAFGASNNGSGVQYNPEFMVFVSKNRFFKCAGVVDHDASVLATWDNNYFYEMKYSGGVGTFGRHWPDRYINNIFYNCPTAPPASAGQDSFAGFAMVSQGSSVHGNIFVDDRLLADPTVAPVLSQVSGGALASRTYYARYWWINDTGQTNVSPEVSFTVSAGSLLVLTHPYTSTYGPPTGAKQVGIGVSTTSNTQTLQGTVPVPWHADSELIAGGKITAGAVSWTEPSSGLVAGTTPPTSNTTQPGAVYGIYENSGGSSSALANIYKNNEFYGIPVPIFGQSGYKRHSQGNLANGYFKNMARSSTGATTSGSPTLTVGTAFFAAGDVGKTVLVTGAGANNLPLYASITAYTSSTQVTLNRNAVNTVTAKGVVMGNPTIVSNSNATLVEAIPFATGNLAGTVTFDVGNGELQNVTLTGNITSTTLTDGHYVGQKLTRIFTMSGSGSYTYTKASNEKLAGGVFLPTSTVGSIDTLIQEWDGTSWLEKQRIMAVA